MNKYQPEYGLGFGVITQAILDYLKIGITTVGSGDKAYHERQAKSWLFIKNNEDYKPALSFEWWCEQLNIDPSRVRRFVKKIEVHGFSERRRLSPSFECLRKSLLRIYEDGYFTYDNDISRGRTTARTSGYSRQE